jgi:hypothetical protein
MPLKPRQRYDRIVSGDADHRGEQRQEPTLGNQSSNLSAEPAVAQLKERGDPWRLNEEAPTAEPPST